MRQTVFAFLVVLLTLVTGLPPAAAADNPDRGVVGHFLLTDMNGQPVSDETYGGKIRLVVFGYTYCPDICPTILNTLSMALDQLGEDRAKVATLFVSVDPERDTPAHLKDYLVSFPDVTGLTGTPSQIAAAAYNFKARYEKQPAADGDPTAYTIDHTASVYVMDRAGNFLARLPHGAAPDRVAERVRGYLHPKRADQ